MMRQEQAFWGNLLFSSYYAKCFMCTKTERVSWTLWSLSHEVETVSRGKIICSRRPSYHLPSIMKQSICKLEKFFLNWGSPQPPFVLGTACLTGHWWGWNWVGERKQDKRLLTVAEVEANFWKYLHTYTSQGEGPRDPRDTHCSSK